MKKSILFPNTRIEEIKNKDVIFFGTSNGMIHIKKLLDVSYHIVGYCDNNKNLWGSQIDDIIIISPVQLKRMVESNENIIIIIASEYYNEIQQQLKELGINTKIYISFTMYMDGYYRLKQRMLKEGWEDRSASKYIVDTHNHVEKYHDEILNSNTNIFLLSPPKTGNRTITASVLDNSQISFLQHSLRRIFHNCEERNKVIQRGKKLIIGIRTPVEQNISYLFQIAYFLSMDNVNDGYNIQKMFNKYIIDSICNENEKRKIGDYGTEYLTRVPMLIQTWFDDVLKEEFGIDIYTKEFDKLKGYSCYEMKDYSIFLYRLDKLNQLEKELGTFLEIDNFKLNNVNIARDKWYSKVYNQFKEEVVLSKDYLDLTYSGKFMLHFYTEQEIIESKKKWMKHIL